MRLSIYVQTVLLYLAASPLQAQCNTAPVALPDTVRVETNAVLVDVLANDQDPDGDALSVSVTDHDCTGSVSVDSFQLVELTTPLSGDCNIAYQITDEEGLTATANVAVTLVAEIFSDGFSSGDTAAWSTTTTTR